MKLRLGTATDAEAIAALIASFQSALTDHPDGEGAEQYIASVSCEAERGYLASSRYLYVLAEEEGILVGFLALRDGTHLFHMFVAKSHQGRGIARRLWQEATARGQGSETTEFTVNSSLQAVPVYRKFGFVPVGGAVSTHGISFVPMRRSPGVNAT